LLQVCPQDDRIWKQTEKNALWGTRIHHSYLSDFPRMYIKVTKEPEGATTTRAPPLAPIRRWRAIRTASSRRTLSSQSEASCIRLPWIGLRERVGTGMDGDSPLDVHYARASDPTIPKGLTHGQNIINPSTLPDEVSHTVMKTLVKTTDDSEARENTMNRLKDAAPRERQQKIQHYCISM
jgi:hypothetical protein